jgi:hypothetical protein
MTCSDDMLEIIEGIGPESKVDMQKIEEGM